MYDCRFDSFVRSIFVITHNGEEVANKVYSTVTSVDGHDEIFEFVLEGDITVITEIAEAQADIFKEEMQGVWFTADNEHVVNITANGVRVEKDDKEAFLWYKKASEQGDAEATNRVAVMPENGIGVEKDEDKAKNLRLLAASAPDED